MRRYDYHRPRSLEEAWQLHADCAPGARFVAGGTDLLVRIRNGTEQPPALVSLRGIGELSRVEVNDAGASIGAGATVAELIRHAPLAARYPVLAEAARALGSAQIRNTATIGGNLCNASPCADLAPPLLVLEARLRIAGPTQTRELPLEDFFVNPGETRLAPSEVVTAVLLGPPARRSAGRFLKKGRVQMDLTLVSAAALIELDDAGRCSRARLAAGSVAPRPLRLHAAEAVLQGAELDRATLARAAAEARGEVSPISDVRADADYRRHMTGVLVERAVSGALEALADRPEGGTP